MRRIYKSYGIILLVISTIIWAEIGTLETQWTNFSPQPVEVISSATVSGSTTEHCEDFFSVSKPVIEESVVDEKLIKDWTVKVPDLKDDNEIRCGGDLWTVQKVITKIDSYRVIITKYACTKGGEYIDGQFYENGKPSTPWAGEEGYSFAGQIIGFLDNIVEDFIGGGDELSIVDTPEGFPLLTLLSSFYGASNNSHTYLLYSTSPVLKKIGEITQPLNEYQVTNGKGSERIVDGFYRDSDGNFLIDRLTTEGTELGVCNACQEWKLETLKLVDGNMVSMGIRDYPENYKRLE